MNHVLQGRRPSTDRSPLAALSTRRPSQELGSLGPWGRQPSTDGSFFRNASEGHDLNRMDFWELHRRLGECYEADLQANNPLVWGPLPQRGRMGSNQSCTKSADSPADLIPESPAQKVLSPLPPPQAPTPLLQTGSGEPADSQGPAPRRSKSPAFSASDPGTSNSLPLPGGSIRKKKKKSKSPSGTAGETHHRKVSLSGGASAVEMTEQSSLSSDHSALVTFDPRPCWAQKSRLGRRASTAISTSIALNSDGEKAKLQIPVTTWSRLQPLNPNGHIRNLWDFTGVLILGVDCVVIPLLFVQPRLFQLFPWLAIQSKMAVCYWLVDFVLSFFTGYLEKGTLVMDLRKIAFRYLSTWFVPDFSVNVLDVVMIIAETAISNDESMRASTRVLRLLRLSRVIRLGKLTKFASFLRDKFESEVTYTQFSLVILILAMCLMEHIVACGWFGIGSLESENTWLSRSEWSNASFTLQYTTALRWAFSQLGVGGTELEAVNEREGVYSNVVALISLITFSSVVSSMTSLVSTLQGQGREETQQFSLLRRFLRVNHIPENLSHRITRFLHYTYHERAANVDDPQILFFLSKSLHAELQLERHREHMEKMPFLKTLLHNPSISFQEGQTLQTLAQRALSSHDLGEDDVVFCHGNTASSAYLLLHGAMTYIQMDIHIQPTQHHWICEMGIWTPWSHLGDLRCQSFSHICALHVQEFCEVMCSSPAVQVQAHSYAKDYVNSMQVENACSDLWVSQLHMAKLSSIKPDHDWNALRSKWTSWVRGVSANGSPNTRDHDLRQVIPQ